MNRALPAAALLAIVVIACGGATPLTDTQRVWCDSRPGAIVAAGTNLGIAPSRLIQHKAQVEQARIDGDDARADELIRQWAADPATGSIPDPHPDLNAMASWEMEAPGDWQRSCAAARAAG